MLCSDELSVVITFCDIRSIAVISQVSKSMRSLVRLHFNINEHDISGIIADIPHALDNLESLSCCEISNSYDIRSINPIIHNRIISTASDQDYECDIYDRDDILLTTGRLGKQEVDHSRVVINSLRMYTPEQLNTYGLSIPEGCEYDHSRYNLLVTKECCRYDDMFGLREETRDYEYHAITHICNVFGTQGSHGLVHRLKRYVKYHACVLRFYGDDFIRSTFKQLHVLSSVMWREISIAMMRSDPITWMRLRDVTFNLDHTISLWNMPEVDCNISIRTRMRLFIILSETLHLIPSRYRRYVPDVRNGFTDLLGYVDDSSNPIILFDHLIEHAPKQFIEIIMPGYQT